MSVGATTSVGKTVVELGVYAVSLFVIAENIVKRFLEAECLVSSKEELLELVP